MNTTTMERLFYLISLIVGVLLLGIFNIPRHSYLLFTIPAIAFILFKPQFRLQIVALVSLAFHFIPVFGETNFMLHAASMTLCLILSYMVLKNLKSFSKELSHIWFLVIFLLAFLLSVVLKEKFLTTFPFYFLVCFSRFVWPLCFMISNQTQNERPHLTLGLLAPFWNFGLYYLPIPLAPPVLHRYESTDNVALKQSFISGLKLFYISLGCTLILGLGHLFFFARPLINISVFSELQNFIVVNSLHLPNVFFNTNAFIESGLFIGTKFFALMVHDVFFVLELFPTFGIAVAVARVSGFRLPRMIYRPLQARTFVQYMGSFLYYYQQLLFKIFVIPALSLRNKISFNRKLTLCVSLLLGSFTFHFIRDLAKVSGPVNEFTLKYGHVFLYLFIIAYVVSSHREKKPDHSYFRVLGYFLIHPFVILGIMFVTRAGRSGSDFFEFLSGIIGVLWR